MTSLRLSMINLSKLEKLKDRHYVGLLFLISLSVVLIWFMGGGYIGGGEEGLPLFNASRVLRISGQPWVEFSTGLMIPAFLPRITMLAFVSLFQVALEPFISQAVVFLLLIFFGVFGVYLLAKELFEEKFRLVYFASSLFYQFNLFTMLQVWNRNIYAGYFAWSLLPIFLFLWIRWLNSKNIKYLFLFLLTSFIFSAAFVTLAFVFVLWIPAGVFTLWQVFSKRKKRAGAIKTTLFALIGVLAWLLVNIWWIYPHLRTSASYVGISRDDNIGVLDGLSKSYPNSELLLLRQKSYFSYDELKEKFWYEFYLSPIVYLLSILALVVVMFGFARFLKNGASKFVVIFFVIAWFLVKGTNPPWGYDFYEFLFNNFPFTAMFRNSYEKLGIVFVLPYSLLFGIGIGYSYMQAGRVRRILMYIMIFLTCGILVWPMWNGRIYADFVKLQIPQEYSQVNELINKDTRDVRILTLPPINGESAFYEWGYRGVVPMEYLFDKPVISHSYFHSPIASFYHRLNEAFDREDEEAVNELLEELNVGYIVHGSDMLEEESGGDDFSKVNSFLSKIDNIRFLQKFGSLDLYEYKGSGVGSRIVATSQVPPKIDYQRIGPQKYIVSVTDVKEPFTLILKNTFSEFWEARIGGEPITNHFVVYDWANAWEVDKTGNYKIELVSKIWPWE